MKRKFLISTFLWTCISSCLASQNHIEEHEGYKIHYGVPASSENISQEWNGFANIYYSKRLHNKYMIVSNLSNKQIEISDIYYRFANESFHASEGIFLENNKMIIPSHHQLGFFDNRQTSNDIFVQIVKAKINDNLIFFCHEDKMARIVEILH